MFCGSARHPGRERKIQLNNDASSLFITARNIVFARSTLNDVPVPLLKSSVVSKVDFLGAQ